MKAFGTLYVAGALSAAVGLLVLVVALARTPSPRLAIVPGAALAGFAMLQGGFGGLIVLAAFGALAIAPRWFMPHGASIAERDSPAG